MSKKVGFVLSGGSLKGVYSHTGLCKCLKDNGITPEAIVGTSAGSVVGGYYASHGSIDGIESVVKDLKADSYIDKYSKLALIGMLFKKLAGFTGMVKGRKMRKFLEKKLGSFYIEDCKLPFYAHVCNMTSRREEILEDGELARAIVASSAIPGIFQMQKINGSYYWDGGIAGYHGLEELLERHGDELDAVIISDFHRYDYEPDNSFMEEDWTLASAANRLLDVVAREFHLLKQELADKYNVKIYTVRPEIPYKVDLEKPSYDLAVKVIEESYKQTEQILKDQGFIK